MKNNSVVTVLGRRSPSVRAVAYFRSSSQSGHEELISFQQNQVRQWAHERGIEIIKEFCDYGPSGIDSNEQPAFTEILADWSQQRSDFEFILCLDASRCGRFPGSDLRAGASEICRKQNKQLIYTSVGVLRD